MRFHEFTQRDMQKTGRYVDFRDGAGIEELRKIAHGCGAALSPTGLFVGRDAKGLTLWATEERINAANAGTKRERKGKGNSKRAKQDPGMQGD